ncbi:MAG: hypothetical protein ASARMPRED_000101 [Alectoria sarmentosa]|nr:MAG: hypothetical protein ASARMPRED_000101 [Alectoria sarmentosa]
MQSKLVISVVLFSAVAFAQSNDFNIDIAEETKVLDELEGFVTALEANPTFQADVAALITALPSSVLQEAEQDPEALIGQIGAGSEAWVSAVPIPVLESLETLVAKPIKAVGDVEGYVEQLVEEPAIGSAVSVLMTAVPKSVQYAFESNPVGFLENIVTATALPSWVTDIPAPLQSDIGSIVNKALSIIDKDLEGGANTSGASSGFKPFSGYAKATGTGGLVGYNGTNGSPSGSPIAYMGAATRMKTAAAGMAALLGGAGVVFNF